MQVNLLLRSKWSIGNVTGTSRKSITNTTPTTDSPTCRVWGRGMLGFNDRVAIFKLISKTFDMNNTCSKKDGDSGGADNGYLY